MPEWVHIVWNNAQAKANGMAKLAKRIEKVHVPRWADAVADAGEEQAKYTVLSGGVNPTKKGGPRVETGAMFDSLDGRKTLKGASAQVRVGFFSPPKHTLWQERGTRSNRNDDTDPRPVPTPNKGGGIPAMLAIPAAKQEMETEIDNSGSAMLRRIAYEWNSSV